MEVGVIEKYTKEAEKAVRQIYFNKYIFKYYLDFQGKSNQKLI